MGNDINNEMKNEIENETIAAVATAMSPAGISIIRMSGDEAIEIADRVFHFKGKAASNRKLKDMPSHTIHYGYIYDEGIKIDEVMILIMKAPRSYTTEDTIEIDCHGGVFVAQRILETVVKAGAALAQPGEFTKRAFLNGRIDLSEAEAVIDVINSQNEFALRSSVLQLSGNISSQIREIRDIILDDVSFIESGLDDPEHISLEGAGAAIYEHNKDCINRLERIKSKSSEGRILKEGINTVIVGKPNAGKSSLMNLLSGSERAIVTEIEGTTRDILEEHIKIGQLSLNLIDTAGIRDTDNIVEKIGVEKAIKVLKDADLVLFVIDASLPLDQNDLDIFQMITSKNTVIILNKSDLENIVTEDEIRKQTGNGNQQDIPVLTMSAKYEKGLDELETLLTDMFAKGQIDYNNELYITNLRQLSAISETLKSLELVQGSIRENMPEDFYTIDLMNAYTQLGYVIGESVEEDLVNRIFEKFCMGK